DFSAGGAGTGKAVAAAVWLLADGVGRRRANRPHHSAEDTGHRLSERHSSRSPPRSARAGHAGFFRKPRVSSEYFGGAVFSRSNLAGVARAMARPGLAADREESPRCAERY